MVYYAAFILLHYFHLTSFFWMFVEGLYLYVLVVQTFHTQRDIKLPTYSAIGWGLPLIVVMVWSIVKWQTLPPDKGFNSIILIENHYDWIYKAPPIVILCINVVFLLCIMWVLITKLRSATNPETKQSRKAAKAFIVLMPLLGITYMVILNGPQKVPVFEYFRALLISSQGFLVAFLYCFMNGEVKRALRHRWSRMWESNCCIGLRKWLCCGCWPCCGPNRRRRRLQQVHEWQPRSRNESIRLYTPASNAFRKRGESSAGSENTTMISLQCGSASTANGANTKSAKILSLQAKTLLEQSTNGNGAGGSDAGGRRKNYVV